MKKQLLLTLLLGSIFINVLYAQDINEKSNNFWKNFKVRKGFESADDKAAPATVSFTLPKDGPNSYLINGGISYTLVKVKHNDSGSVKTTFAPFFVLNRNTLIAKEQNNYNLGITNSYRIGNLSEPQRRLNYFLLDNSLQYQRDKIDTSHSLIITSTVSIVKSGSGIYFNTYKKIEKGLLYLLGWSVGPEFQYKFTSSDSSMKGGVGRIFYTIEAHLLQKWYKKGDPNPELGDPFLELVIQNTGRYDLFNSTYHKEGYLPLFKAGLLIYPKLSYDFSIGFSYNTGSDPIAGLAKQDFYLLALNFKL